MKLVEVVNTSYTNEPTTAAVMELAAAMGKDTRAVQRFAGFIVNRVARPYYIESLRMLEEGVITIEQADELLEASGFKLGLFKLDGPHRQWCKLCCKLFCIRATGQAGTD